MAAGGVPEVEDALADLQEQMLLAQQQQQQQRQGECVAQQLWWCAKAMCCDVAVAGSNNRSGWRCHGKQACAGTAVTAATATAKVWASRRA